MRNYEQCRVGSFAAVVAAIAWSGLVLAQPPADAPPGNAQRGAPLFADKYNCYACHGFDAQSGERRLVPLNYTVESFIAFVQRSPLPQMPAFPDASPQELADIYAYIRSLPADAPAVKDLPQLRGILERKLEAFEN